VGSSFFKSKVSPAITGGGNAGLQARAIGSIGAGARGAGIGAQKDLARAEAVNKAHPFKPPARSAAYAKGPKI
jgi:hypothetical protein